MRIIAGRWRGRRIAFSGLEGLRPTPDRVRETVFNWLDPYIDGARVLDLFAGSGVLGFEALSRGAFSVTAVDASQRVARRLREAAAALGAERYDVAVADAGSFIGGCNGGPFDLVFLDPPHESADYDALCRGIEESALVRPAALIYVELPTRRAAGFEPPAAWERHRASSAGNLTFGLWRRRAD